MPSSQSGALAAADEASRGCLREWLARVPDHRSPLGRRHLAAYARNHWGIENREHYYVRDKTFSEDLQQVRTGSQPNAYAAIRNLVIGAFRRAGYANIAHARRFHARDHRRILALYGYT